MTDATDRTWEDSYEMGRQFAESKQFDRAELAFLAALRQAEAFGDDDPRVASTLNALARVYRQQKRFLAAVALLHRLVGIMERALGAENVQICGVLANLADTYTQMAGYEEEELTLRQRMLAIREKSSDRDAIALARLRDRIAVLRKTVGPGSSFAVPVFAEQVAEQARPAMVKKPSAPSPASGTTPQPMRPLIKSDPAKYASPAAPAPAVAAVATAVVPAPAPRSPSPTSAVAQAVFARANRAMTESASQPVIESASRPIVDSASYPIIQSPLRPRIESPAAAPMRAAAAAPSYPSPMESIAVSRPSPTMVVLVDDEEAPVQALSRFRLEFQRKHKVALSAAAALFVTVLASRALIGSDASAETSLPAPAVTTAAPLSSPGIVPPAPAPREMSWPAPETRPAAAAPVTREREVERPRPVATKSESSRDERTARPSRGTADTLTRAINQALRAIDAETRPQAEAATRPREVNPPTFKAVKLSEKP